MRVLRVVVGLEAHTGGPVEIVLGSVSATNAAGIRNLVLFPDGGAESAAAVERLDVASVNFRSFRHIAGGGSRARRWGVSTALVRELPRLARSHDVVHAESAWTVTSLAALAAAKLARVPYVLTPHESLTAFDVAKSPLPKRLVKRFLRRLYVAFADAIVVSSELELSTSLVGWRARRKFAVVPHALAMDAAGPLADVETKSTDLTLGFLGRFDKKKNLPVLLSAVAAGPRTVRLRIAGDGDTPTPLEVKEQAEALGIADRVELLGWLSRDARCRFLASLDVLVMPSAFECFGMAAAEALVAGVPVVVSPTTGIAEIVRRNECGLIVEADVSALADVLAGLVNCDTVATLAARTAGACAELSYEKHARALAAVYCRISPESASPMPDAMRAVVS